MDTQQFLSPDFLKFFVPLAGAVVAWAVNEWRRRLADQHAKKEERYASLLRALRGFYVVHDDGSLGDEVAEELRQLRSDFVEQVNICWLYCPDDVIRKAYAFLGTVRADVTTSGTTKASAAGDLVEAVRTDILKRKLVRSTKLVGSDFKHLAELPPNV